MTWLIVVVSVLVVTVIVYFLFPIFKRMSKNRQPKEHTKSSKQQRREERKEIKEQKKIEKQAEKEEALVVKENPNVRTIENDEDLFTKEDPDTKVNYENFDLGGLFSGDEDNKINNFSDGNNTDESMNANYEEMFDKYFSDNKPSNSTQYRKFNDTFKDEPFEMSSDGNIDGDEADIENILQSRNLFPGSGLADSEIKQMLDGMSPEMKALMLSNFLDKKDY